MSVFRSGLFSGKVAIVTGGGTGIGKAIATELLHLGKIWHFFEMLNKCFHEFSTFLNSEIPRINFANESAKKHNKVSYSKQPSLCARRHQGGIK